MVEFIALEIEDHVGEVVGTQRLGHLLGLDELIVGIEFHLVVIGSVLAKVVHAYAHLGLATLEHCLGSLDLSIEVVGLRVADEEAVDVEVLVGFGLDGEVEGDEGLIGPRAEIDARGVPLVWLEVGIVDHASHMAHAVGSLHLDGDLGVAALGGLVMEHQFGSINATQTDLARAEVGDVLLVF